MTNARSNIIICNNNELILSMRMPRPRWTGFETDLRPSESETTTTVEPARKKPIWLTGGFRLTAVVRTHAFCLKSVGFFPFFFIRVFSTTLAKTSSGQYGDIYQGKIIILWSCIHVTLYIIYAARIVFTSQTRLAGECHVPRRYYYRYYVKRRRRRRRRLHVMRVPSWYVFRIVVASRYSVFEHPHLNLPISLNFWR